MQTLFHFTFLSPSLLQGFKSDAALLLERHFGSNGGA